MHIRESFIKGLLEIAPRVFADARGFFFESFNQAAFQAAGLPAHFVQDNQSFSVKGTLRGLHFQRAPHAQGKLVRVLRGEILDVAVDLREDSPTYGQYDTFVLDGQDHRMAYIPEGFAHGFLALTDCLVSYKCTQLYHQSSEGGIRWDDPTLGIAWPLAHPLVSDKDQALPLLRALTPQ